MRNEKKKVQKCCAARLFLAKTRKAEERMKRETERMKRETENGLLVWDREPAPKKCTSENFQ